MLLQPGSLQVYFMLALHVSQAGTEWGGSLESLKTQGPGAHSDLKS